MSNEAEIHPIDLLVGKRLRSRRSTLGLSQEEVGKYLDVSFQQIQKYERGINRISASTLHSLSVFLKVSILYFFDEAEINYGDAKQTIALVARYHSMSDANKKVFLAMSLALSDKYEE